MTPPKATPDRKGKVCKPKFKLVPKNEMKELKRYSPIKLDEMFGLLSSKLLSDESKN